MEQGRSDAGPRRIAGRGGPLETLADRTLLDRFAAGGDAATRAFEVIVARHGPMIRAVCRSILGPSPDAEDAFQATFLILFRRAGAIRRHDSLACWLHGVARRVALRIRNQAATRRARERGAAGEVVARGIDPGSEELVESLHEEIGRLPGNYRAPLVLCGLEGRTQAEAARLLGWPVGTVSGRLARARVLLRARCSRRGMVLPLVGMGLITVPRPLPAAVMRAPNGAAETLARARGSLRVLGLIQLRCAAGLLGAVGLVGLGVGLPDRDHRPTRLGALTPPMAAPSASRNPREPDRPATVPLLVRADERQAATAAAGSNQSRDDPAADSDLTRASANPGSAAAGVWGSVPLFVPEPGPDLIDPVRLSRRSTEPSEPDPSDTPGV